MQSAGGWDAKCQGAKDSSRATRDLESERRVWLFTLFVFRVRGSILMSGTPLVTGSNGNEESLCLQLIQEGEFYITLTGVVRRH